MLVVETIARIRREYFVKRKPIKEIVRDVKVSRNNHAGYGPHQEGNRRAASGG